MPQTCPECPHFAIESHKDMNWLYLFRLKNIKLNLVLIGELLSSI